MKFLIFLLFLILPDLYIHKILLCGQPWSWKLLLWSPLALAMIVLVLGFCGLDIQGSIRVMMYVIVGIGLPKLAFCAFSFVGHLLERVLPGSSSVGNLLGAVMGSVVLALMSYGFVCGWKRLVVNEIELAFEDLPEAFDGYRIAQISDLHLGTFSKDVYFIQDVVDRVNSLDADAVLFTGDIVNIIPDEICPFTSYLSQLRARDGVFSVLGNHDYCVYDKDLDEDGLEDARNSIILQERNMGWRLLLNENVVLRRGADSLAIVGVENVSRPPYPSAGDLAKALDGLEKGTFKVLMSHDPTHWRSGILPESDVQLTLSGHTHAMQLSIFGISPVVLIYREWGGVYSTPEGRILNVCTGTGGNVKFRFGAWPQIVHITLRRK